MQTDGDKDEVVWTEKGPMSDLLGFDFGSTESLDRSGLKALINSAIVSHRRLPMLDVVFDRTARLMSTSLRLLTNENVEVSLDNVTSSRLGDFMETQKAGVIGVMHSTGLDGYALIAVDAALAHCVVDLLLGGHRAVAGAEERALTTIELGLAERVLAMLIEDFDEAFRPVKPVGFTLDRVETTPRFAAIAQDASVCVLAKFKVRIEEFSGRLVILAPHATIEPARDLLLRDFMGESGAADEMWRRRLGLGVNAAGVELCAVLADRTMTIGELEKLSSGDTVTFSSGEARVELRTGAVAVAKGNIGRIGERIAVKLLSGLAANDLGDAA